MIQSHERSVLLAAAALMSALAAPHALAQSTAPAATASSETAGLDEIVVTARRRDENVQRTPVAISAFTGEDIARLGITSASSVAAVTPSLTIESSVGTDPFTSLISIRGQAQNDPSPFFDQSIGLYQDGVYFGSSYGFGLNNLLDTARVEVLKGPQGALYGRNTTGGAFSVYSNDPTNQLEGSITAGYGNNEAVDVRGVLNIPLGDDAALRVVGAHHDDDGYARNTLLDKPLGDLESDYLRATLKAQPTEKLTVYLRGDWTRAEAHGPATRPRAMYTPSLASAEVASELTNNPAYLFALLGAPPPADFAAQMSAAETAYTSDAGPDFRDAQHGFAERSKADGWGSSLTLQYDLGAAQIKSISAFRSYKSPRFVDLDASSYDIVEGYLFAKLRQLTQEFQLTGTALDDRLSYVAGLYYYRLRAQNVERAALAPPFLFVNETDVKGTSKSYAAFGQTTYAITPTINATLGLRYTQDERSLDARSRQDYSAIGGPSGLTCGNIPPFGVLGVGSPPECSLSGDTDDDNFSYTAGLDWTVADGVFLYAKTSTGYRAGGINPRPNFEPNTFDPYDAETVRDVEIGAKLDFWDRRVRFNVSAYESKYKDAQSRESSLPAGQTAVVRNAGQARIRGVEIEATIAPVRDLVLRGTVAYTDPEYQRYIIPIPTGTSAVLTQDVSSRDFFETPQWSYSLFGVYTLPVAFGELAAQANYSWKSRTNLYPGGGVNRVGEDDFDQQASYGLLGGRLSAKLEDSGIEVALWGRNLTNRKYFANVFDPGPGFGIVTGVMGRGREYGVEVTKNF